MKKVGSVSMDDFLRTIGGSESGYSFDVALRVIVTDEDVRDLVSTALCGGIGYWAKLDNSGHEFEDAPADECIDETVARLLMEGKTVKLIDEEDGDVIDWTLADLLCGVKRYVESGADGYSVAYDDGSVRLDTSYVDADVADQVVQLGLFGEVVYG